MTVTLSAQCPSCGFDVLVTKGTASATSCHCGYMKLRPDGVVETRMQTSDPDYYRPEPNILVVEVDHKEKESVDKVQERPAS